MFVRRVAASCGVVRLCQRAVPAAAGRAVSVDANTICNELQRLQDQLGGICPKPLNYGEIIDRLQAAISKAERGANEYLSFSWGSAYPRTIGSYRGYYEHVGIGYSGDHGGTFAGGFLEKMQDAIGSDMHGYKGGEYMIHRECEVWVACNGCTSNTRIIDVRMSQYSGIEFVTAQIED